MPESVCAGDRFSTLIEVSGARSAARLSLVPSPPDPDAPPLVFEWLIEGDEFEIVEGAIDEPELAVAVAGDRPLHLTLTVINGEGGVAETLRSIGVVDREAPPC